MVRQATMNDLNNIAVVHTVCFPDSFSTALGARHKLLEHLYSEYIETNSELFLVAEDKNNEIVGFCMGYYCERNDYQKRFLRNNTTAIIGRMIYLLLSGNRTAWNKIISLFHREKNELIEKRYENIPNDKRGDLLSICVLPEYRGKRISQELIESYEKVLIQNGRVMCLLTVRNKNERGIGFYKKNGYSKYMYKGKDETTFYKMIGQR